MPLVHLRIPLAHLRMPLALFAIVAAFYWKLTLTQQFDWVWGPFLTTQVMPWYQEQARSWHAGTFPLWDPYLWAGQPLLGQALPGAAYPLNWILFLLPLEEGVISMMAMQWYFVVIRAMAAVFCYWLCRDLERSRAASLAAGLVFALSGFVGTTGRPAMVNAAVWIPLVFLFLLRAVRGTNVAGNAALSGMFLGLAWLSGDRQIPMVTSAAAAGAWLYFILRTGRPNRRLAGAAMVAVAFAGMSGALQILPAYEYGRAVASGPLASRWAGAAEPVPKPASLPGIVFPNNHAQFDPFIGVAALALAAIGFACAWRDARVRSMAGVMAGVMAGLTAALMAVIPAAAIPAFDKGRAPSVAVAIFQFGAAVLAAFGLDRLSAGADDPWPKRIAWAVLGFGVLIFAVYQALFFANKMTFPGDPSVLITAFLALLLAALLFGWKGGSLTRAQACVLMILLLLLELGNNYGTLFADRTDKGRTQWLAQIRGNQDVAEFLRKQPGFFRADVGADEFAPNWGAWHGVEMWRGHRPEARLLYGVRYTIATHPAPGAGEEVFSGQSGMKVYQNGAAFPRAWAVHKLAPVRDMTEANAVMLQQLPEMRHQAVLVEFPEFGRPRGERAKKPRGERAKQPPALEPCGAPDWVELLEHGADRLLIRANMACAGMVILSDTYFPGWRARVDGKPAEIYEVNGAMRGMAVPAGLHTVTMRYRPESVILGGVLTLAGILGAVGLWLRGRG